MTVVMNLTSWRSYTYESVEYRGYGSIKDFRGPPSGRNYYLWTTPTATRSTPTVEKGSPSKESIRQKHNAAKTQKVQERATVE